MKALSLREPWAAFMIRGIKRIENRSWSTRVRGRILVHASSWWGKTEAEDCWDVALHIAEHAGLPRIPVTLDEVKARRGGIVGCFTIVDCVSRSDDPFFFGKYGFVVEDAIAFDETIPCRGSLGFFDPPPEAVERAIGLIDRTKRTG